IRDDLVTGVQTCALPIFERALLRSARPGAFTEADLVCYREAWSQPGALTAMLNWYRALHLSEGQFPATPLVTVPTLILWGENDRSEARRVGKDGRNRRAQ